LHKTDLFGLNRIRKEDTVLLVEGYPDASYLPALGLTNVVALGQAAFSEKYVAGIRAKNLRRIVLALDNDDAGQKSTEAICQLFADDSIELFVIDKNQMAPQKDPDEYVMANGLPAFQNIVAKAQSASMWMSKRIMSKHDISSDLGRSKAIGEVLEYADSLRSPAEAERIVKDMLSTTGLSPETIEAEFEHLKDERAALRLKEGIAELGNEVRRRIDDGDVQSAEDLVASTPSELLSEYRKTKHVEETSFAEFLNHKKSADQTRVAGQRIGFELKTFAIIDQKLRGLQQGLYIVAADPNIGKTALMVSLSLDVLLSNPDSRVLFYTMDDSKDAIVNRYLAHRTDIAINKVRFKPDVSTEKTLHDAYAQLGQWALSGRLDIKEVNEWLTMGAIYNDIQKHPQRDKLVVFIDGLYNVPVDANVRSIREENIERANQVKQLVKVFKVPVIATAEFRKKDAEEARKKKGKRTIHDIMETGKYGYNADVVWLLSPEDEENYVNQDEPMILLDFGKNKLESFRGTMKLKFIREKSVMTPSQDSSF
jgi:replicative DNA helicase